MRLLRDSEGQALDRPLYSPPLKPRIEQQMLLEGQKAGDSDGLLDQMPIDKAHQHGQIRREGKMYERHSC